MIRNSPPSHLTASWLVIVNPHAGNGAVGREWPMIQRRLVELLPNPEVEISTHSSELITLVEGAAQRGIRHVLAVGGDGTAHQVVNAIRQQSVIPGSEITFALLPLGTGNDWIKSHGIPRKWPDWKAYFLNATPTYQNLGRISYLDAEGPEERYFMNVAGLAYDAFVVRYTDGKKSPLPGKLFYFWATFRCLFQYQPQSATLRFDDREYQGAFYTINVGIGRYSGGGMQLVPHARTQGDSFALTYVGRVGKLSVILNSFRFYAGRIKQFNKAFLTYCRGIEILPDTEMLIEADGEFLGHCPASISLVQDGLSILVPTES